MIDLNETFVRSNPKSIPTVFNDRLDTNVRKSRNCVVRFELPILEHCEPVLRTDPQPSGTVGIENEDLIAGERRFIVAVEDHETRAVKPRKSFLGAYP